MAPTLRTLVSTFESVCEDVWATAQLCAKATRDSMGRNVACSMLAGVATFGSTLAVSTLTQQRLLRMSTGTPPPVPTAVGILTVCAASLASHQAALSTQIYLETGQKPYWKFWQYQQLATSGYHQDTLDLKVVQIPWHTIRICLLGCVAYKVIGRGRFWGIAPSSYTHLGSFAHVRTGSIPAKAQYANPLQRATIERMGKTIGCHTCGSKRLFQPKSTTMTCNFIADHQPPKSVADQINSRWFNRLLGRKVSFRFFPQCVDCSSIQGSLLGKASLELLRTTNTLFVKRPDLREAGGGINAYYHGLRPRWNHLTGGVIGGLAVIGANQADWVDGNLWRYNNWNKQFTEWLATKEKMIHKKRIQKRRSSRRR